MSEQTNTQYEPQIGDRVETKEGWKGIVTESLGHGVFEVDLSVRYDSSELTLIDSTPEETADNTDVSLPVSRVKGKPVIIKSGGSVTIEYPDIGFNPETLEFDGVKIKVGDELEINKLGNPYTVLKDSHWGLAVNIMEHDNSDKEFRVLLGSFNVTAHYPKQSQHDKLTFDGVEIKKGDEIQIGNNDEVHCVCADVDTDPVKLGIYLGEDEGGIWYDLECFNVTAHYPKQSELEKLEEEYRKAENIIQANYCKSVNITLVDLDRYYQARKRVEDIKAKENN